ncbi:putative SAM50 Sorting and Assembly Machinery (SAM) complex subunit protein [Rutstroemia sp. NJR-2017a WRK4]|nr:putative SAM50 Sorting and Assembly Machinery (SAM) complex subunit protein [Rutstroemia sp. NJR-2017a WRK4]
MATPNGPKETLVESLLKTDPKIQEEYEQIIQQKHMSHALQAAQRNSELIGNNSTKPVTISSIRLLGAEHTRRSFLNGIFNPLLSANRDAPYTLSEALQEISTAADKLRRHGIFHDDISMFIDKPDPTDPSSSPSDIDIYIQARERGRVTLKTGTDLGNTEGSAYGNAQWRNIFGGAETLNINAAAGTRTRSAYQATFETPILSDPEKRISVEGLSSSTSKPWASHEEVLKGGALKYTWTSSGSTHQVGYSGMWRQVTGLAENASPTVRNDAGDSVKSSITHTWLKDKRNHPLLPNNGYLLKTISEIAGWGPLKGDVGFWKSEMESSGAVKVPGIPGASLTAGIRAGMLYPLGVGFGGAAQPSRINDRFQLGGPTDVRGFKIGGLGPRDRQDAVGGDVYAASSINLLLPFPRVDISTPLRLQVFANAGRLLALKSRERNTSKNVYSTVGELGKEIPSMAVGLGVVYAHPVARFELNFGLPIVVRKGEETRKGLQFGVGINFL